MWSAALSLLFVVFSSGSSATFTSSTLVTLSQQCWHEYVLRSAEAQSSLDGQSEIIHPLSISQQTFMKNEKQHWNSKYKPWTHEPICTEILQGLGSELCVYTDASFSNGRGISIFTTPKTAEEFTMLPAFTDPSSLIDKKINVDLGAWTTAHLPGKGVGMLAAKRLVFGDRVTAYTPALLAYLEGELGTLEREKYFALAISQLPLPIRDSFLALATVYGDPRIRHQDIVKANTFQLEVGGQNHLAVFPETSRLNHDCAPNAQYVINGERLTHEVRATRDIEEGEEITISYTSPLERTEERQHHLKEGFLFMCSCARCTKKDETDATLGEMIVFQRVLNDWSSTSTATPKMAEQLLALYRQEGLEGFLDVPYGFAALAYNAEGNSEKAGTYAAKAKEAILMKDGEWSVNLGIWEELLRDPKKHWSYKRRM